MADHVVDDYMAVTDAVQNDIDAVETAVFSENGGRGDAGRIYQLKRELLELRRAVAPLSRPLERYRSSRRRSARTSVTWPTT